MSKPLPTLLPCPFCGNTKPNHLETITHSIVCSRIKCNTYGPERTTERGAINAWNTRKWGK